MATDSIQLENDLRERSDAASGNAAVEAALNRRYDAGFVTDIESESLPPGLDEGVVRAISARKGEPEWMTEWRLKAYRHWLTMRAPETYCAFPEIFFPSTRISLRPESSAVTPIFSKTSTTGWVNLRKL